MEIADILTYITEATHYLDYLKEKYFSDHEARWNNIGELVTLAKEEHHIGDDDPITQTQQSQKPDTNGLDIVGVEVVEEGDNDNEGKQCVI